jgi:tetratricopeptide (TPR) repeat protein
MERNPAELPTDAEEAQLAAAVDHPACASVVLKPDSCQGAIQLGNLWLGWIAWRRGDSITAARLFSSGPISGWPHWMEGQQAFRAGDYKVAAARYGEAFDLWREPARQVVQLLNPLPDTAPMLTEFGEAQLLAGNAPAALATLDAAVKADSASARAIYLRGRAREAAGQADAAMGDYNLASRTAFAAAAGRSSGEAHLYRGILLYRSKDWPRAEDEFADALNFDIPAAMKSDATAWRHLAAVASGSCGASRAYLEQSLAAVSPDFPKDDARSALAACGAAGSAGSPLAWSVLK